MAKNNVFNLPFIGCLKGVDGSESGLACFRSVEFCLRAWFLLMKRWRARYGVCTVGEVVARFSEDDPESIPDYEWFVCDAVCCSPTFILREEDYIPLAVAMARFESGAVLSKAFVALVRFKYNIRVCV